MNCAYSFHQGYGLRQIATRPREGGGLQDGHVRTKNRSSIRLEVALADEARDISERSEFTHTESPSTVTRGDLRLAHEFAYLTPTALEAVRRWRWSGWVSTGLGKRGVGIRPAAS